MTNEEIEAAWAELDVEPTIATRLYSLIIKGMPKDMFHLTDDESKAWDLIVADMEEQPAPEGSTYAIPNE